MNPTEMREQLDELRGSMEIMADVNVELAKILKQKYDCFVTAGFTPTEALEIIKSRGIES